MVRSTKNRPCGSRPSVRAVIAHSSRPDRSNAPVPLATDGAQREEPRMPVRPVEQAEPVGEPHAGQVHAIIDGPVEPAMVGEQELGAEQADAGRIQENIACQAFSVFARRFAVFSPGVGSDGMMRTPSGVSAMKQAHPLAISMGFMPSRSGSAPTCRHP